MLDALFADDAVAAVAVFLHQRKYVLDRLFGPLRELEFGFLPLFILFFFPLFDKQVEVVGFIEFFIKDVVR